MCKFYDMTASPTVVIGPNPIREIIEKLKDIYQAQEIDTTVFPAYMPKMQQNNACNYAQDRHMDIQLENINIKVRRISQEAVTNQTEDYTEYVGLQKRYSDTYSSID